MKKCVVVLFCSILSLLAHGQQDSLPLVKNIRLGVGGGYSLLVGHGYMGYVAAEFQNDRYLSLRFFNGKETHPESLMGLLFNENFRRFPLQHMESTALLYGMVLNEKFRLGIGLSYVRGNARGSLIYRDLRTAWHEDKSFRAIGIPVEYYFHQKIWKGLCLDAFMVGEINQAQTHFVVGAGISYFW